MADGANEKKPNEEIALAKNTTEDLQKAHEQTFKQHSAQDFSLKHCELFVCAAEDKTLQSVADTLCVSLASVSRGITQLEDALGAPLLERSRGNNTLTDAGRTFLPYAQQIFQYQLNLIQATGLAVAETDPDPVKSMDNKNRVKRGATRVSLPQIQAFIAVAAAGSFASAARTSQHTQSSLSRHVVDLECALEATLLTRLPNGVAITAAGLAGLPVAKELLQWHAQACNAMTMWRTDQQRKLLIVGSLAVMPKIMPQLLRKLKTDFTQHLVEVKCDFSGQIEQAVMDGKANLGLCAVITKKPELIYTPLLKVQLGVICSPRMQPPLLPKSLGELAHLPFVRFSDNALITQTLISHRIHFPAYYDSFITMDSVESGLDLIQEGEYAMIVSGIGADRKAAHDLTYIPLPGLLPAVEISIITRRSIPFDERSERLREVLANSVVQTEWHRSIRLLRRPADN